MSVEIGEKPERHGAVLDLAAVRLRAVRPSDMLFEPAEQPEGPRTIFAGMLLRGVLDSDVAGEIGEQPVRRRTVQAPVHLDCVMLSDVAVEVSAPPESHGTVLADVRLRCVRSSDVLVEVVEQREPVATPRVHADVRSSFLVDRRAVPLEVLGTREILLTLRADLQPRALIDRIDVHREVGGIPGRPCLQRWPVPGQDPTTSCRSVAQVGASQQGSCKAVHAIETSIEKKKETTSQQHGGVRW